MNFDRIPHRIHAILCFAAATVAALLVTGCGWARLPRGNAGLGKSIEQSPPQPPSPIVCCLPPYRPEQDNLSARIPAAHSIYFGDDEFQLPANDLPIVEAHSRYLLTHKKSKVLIVGNTDERGSREYNMALGQKRTDAVKSALNLYGVPDTQMVAISYGSERPKAKGSDEAAWSVNRRTDIVYP